MTGFLTRWMIAFGLLTATYNPTPWNYVAWTQSNFENAASVSVLLGLLLVISYIIYLRATLRSIGLFGMMLVSSVVAALVWVLIDFGVITLENPDFRLWLGILGLSFVLGIGLSWSHVRRAISGQADVDDVDE